VNKEGAVKQHPMEMRPIYDERFNLAERRPVSAERTDR
jgi:hypothetical protein